MLCIYIQCNITQPLKKEILPLDTTWMDLEGIMLSEICQRKTPHDLTHMCNLKKENKKQTYSHRENMGDYCGVGGKIGEGD